MEIIDDSKAWLSDHSEDESASDEWEKFISSDAETTSSRFDEMQIRATGRESCHRQKSNFRKAKIRATISRGRRSALRLPDSCVRKKDMFQFKKACPVPSLFADETDVEDSSSNMFRTMWMRTFGLHLDSFEQTTSVPAMRYTDGGSASASADPMDTVQIFEVKITSGNTGCLRWPLDVFGVVAARDMVDFKRNIIFERSRDNCQTISEESPYLALTGPPRAIVLLDPVYFEVDLKMKGSTESEDQDLIFLAEAYRSGGAVGSFAMKSVYSGKISALELTFGHMVNSVEATISAKVIRGSWPDVYRACFTAKTASIDYMAVVLLDVEDDKLPVADGGVIKLSRRVVCAELRNGEQLEVSVWAQCVDGKQVDDGLLFKPERAGRHSGRLRVGSCEVEVSVAWSLLSSTPSF